MVAINPITSADKNDSRTSPLPDNQKFVADEYNAIKTLANALHGQTPDTGFTYIGEANTAGSIRLRMVSDALEMDRYESGAYVCKMRIRETSVQTEVPLTTTPTSVIFGDDGSEVASAGQALIFESTDGSDSFLIQNSFNSSTGSGDFLRSRLIGRNTYTIQPLKDVNSSSDPQFTYTISAIGPSQSPALDAEDRRHTDAVTIESPDTGTFSAVFREDDENGRLLRTESGISITADTETEISLVKPICLDVGTVVHVTITGGIRLKGTTIIAAFAPFLKSRSYLGYNDKIATESAIGDFAGGIVTALEALSGAARLDHSAIDGLDQQIRDIVASTLAAGTGISITPGTDNNPITIAATGGGGTPNPPNDFRYGLSSFSDPASVVWADLNDIPTPTDPITVSTGLASAGQYFHIFSANTHDIQTITDTVLSQVVYRDGAGDNIFTKQDNVRTEATVTYDGYRVGPLNAGVNEEYIVRFS